MHPYEAAIEFLLNEHLRTGDAQSSAAAERHLNAIAEARAKAVMPAAEPDPDKP